MSTCLYAGGTEGSDVNTSCPMILRSVCQHPRTRTSSSMPENTCHECHTQNLNEDISNGSTTIKSKTEKHFLTQSKSIFSQTKTTFSQSKTVSSELKIASLKHSSQIYLKKDGRCNTALREHTNNNLPEKIDAMSRTRNRSSTSDIRALSGSDTEYDENEGSSLYTSLQNRSKRFSANHSSGHNRSVKSKSSSQHVNNNLSSSSHSFNEILQNHSDSTEWLGWLRWLVWRNFYSMLLRVHIFEIRVLSSVTNFGRKKSAFLMLLPLLIWFMYHGVMYSSNNSPVSSLDGICVDELDQEQPIDACGESNFEWFPIFTKFHERFSGLSNSIQSYFDKSEEKSSSESASNIHHPAPPYQFHKEDIQVLSQEVLKLINGEKRQSDIHSSQQKTYQDEHMKAELLTLHAEFRHLNEKIIEMEKKMDGLQHLILLLKNCCSKKLNVTDFYTEFESHLITALKNITEESNSSNSSSYDFFRKWIDSRSVSQVEIQSAFKTLRKDFRLIDEEDFNKAQKQLENIIKQQMEAIKTDLHEIRSFSSSERIHSSEFSSVEIKKAIDDAIQLYDSDKNGLVDYALESGGGSVLGTRCSETFLPRNARFSVFGIPVWYSSNSPRTAIQPNFHPGDCWPFKGTQGFLVIQLSANILITGFSLEHIPVNLSPSGNIDSAPKDFSVWGLTSEKDSAGSILGKYTYNKDGQPLQYFEAQDSKDQHFSFVELKVHSNHGNPDYTCIYRFRVHGTRK